MADIDFEKRKEMNKVLEYIEQNLDQKVSLEELAKQSSYSPFHFHRVFQAVVGETPADYVKRLRLEKAAHYLIYEPQLSVTEISMICGFSSISYFTYSFKEYFGHSPKAWREGAYLEKFPRQYLHSKKSKKHSINKKENGSHSGYNEFQWIDLSKVKTVVFPEYTTVLRQNVGPYTEGMEKTWESIFRWSEARDLIQKDTLMIGIPRNNPYITPPDKSRYDCCITVNEVEGVGDAEMVTFHGGKYVVFEFEEPIDYSERQLMIECYSELYSYWLPRSGYRYLGNPVEFIQLSSVPGTLDLQCKVKAIALAIEPK